MTITKTCQISHQHNYILVNFCTQKWKDNVENRGMRVNYYYYYNRFTALWILSGTTQMSRYQKGKTKTNLDFLEQETVSGSGISWAICKSAPRPRQITMPTLHHSVFYRPDALPAT